MNWARTRYGLPIILYQWVVGAAGCLFLIYCYVNPPFAGPAIDTSAFLLFIGMHVVASFLHFQYARLAVVITFESSFTTAALLVFGCLPAVFVSVVGIVIGSLKRVIHRRFILKRNIPLSYDLSIIFFNAGMVAAMWFGASWIYIWLLQGELPLRAITPPGLFAILMMFVGMSLINHIILLAASYIQGLDTEGFIRKALFPAFLTELATIPFGVIMAIAYTQLGSAAFAFLGITLLLSNAVLRNLSIIRYDQEEKIRQGESLNHISSQIISLREEEAIIKLVYSETAKIFETNSVFVSLSNDNGKELRFSNTGIHALYRLAEHVMSTREPLLIKHAKRDAPKEHKKDLLSAQVRSCILIPLIAAGKLYGVIGVFSKEFTAFQEQHMLVLLTIANQAALALENSRLYSDLTDKVQELEFLNKELRQVDRMKSEFLSNVSHELRTPLTSIKGYVEFMLKQKLGPINTLQQEGLTVAQRNITRLQRLINDLLDYTRLEFKRTPLALTPCSLEQLWTEVYDEYAESIAMKKLTLHVTIPPTLPVLFVDPGRFLQVLGSLTSNAIKFTQDGGDIWVETEVLEHSDHFYNLDLYERHCHPASLIPVVITIRDNGVGIPADALPKIFERFYQADSSQTRKYGGTGLGLAIVKSILSAHGANIQAESIVGEGTTFRMIVPAIHAGDVRSSLKHPPVPGETVPKYIS